jgi:arylsulfatase A
VSLMLARLAKILLLAFGLLLSGCGEPPSPQPPNIVIIFADDLGYGDLGSYGHPTIRTPNLDRMAAEGMKLTQFYAAASVCTPSRAGLLTGRLPIRSGMAGNGRRVLFPDSRLGLPAEEVTIAEVLKGRGYTTAAIGKWHLGHLPEFLPTRHGFDSYLGIPYSNDMDQVKSGPIFREPEYESWNVPLMRDEEIIERPADQRTITRRYTEEAVRLISEQRDGPLFIYLAHNLPHVPLFRSEAFEGVSPRGLYGDVIEEIDWSVGQIMQALESEGIAENTLLFFTSDNGPWLVYGEQGGSAGLLRGGKGMTWEGGMREPALAWWPGTIPAGTVRHAVTSTMDLLPTAAAMAGAQSPDESLLDGRSLLQLLKGESSQEVRDAYYFYRGATLYAVRKGPWKAHFTTQWAYTPDNNKTEHSPPGLYNLDTDPSEKYDVAADHPEVVAEIRALAEQHLSEVIPAESRLDARIGDLAKADAP